MTPHLPALLYEGIIDTALAEDFGRAGDLTSDSLFSAADQASAKLVARKDGCLAGVDVAAAVFKRVDSTLQVRVRLADGAALTPGAVIADIEGPARSLLAAERVALNLLCRMSGVATATRNLARHLEGTQTRLAATRKTTPGLRALEKYAVRVGGGLAHRYGLDDAMMIKDNHIAACGGLTEALKRARTAAGHLMKIEVEVDTLTQLDELIAAGGADVVLLDNMDPPTIAQAVARVRGALGHRMLVEVSGGITPERLPALAALGVDVISTGWLTHSAPILDIGLDM